MIQANVAQVKNHLSEYLLKVKSGECVEICRRNIPLARMTPVESRTDNGTVLGCGRGTVKIKCDLTEPVWSESDWAMLES